MDPVTVEYVDTSTGTAVARTDTVIPHLIGEALTIYGANYVITGVQSDVYPENTPPFIRRWRCNPA